MNILITGSKDYPAFSSKGIISGGMEVMVTEYAQHMPAEFRMILLAGRRGKPAFEKNERITLYRLPIIGSSRMQPLSLCSFSIFAALALHRRVNISLPQSSLAAIPALLLKIAYGIPYIVYSHSYNTEKSHAGNRLFAFLYRIIERVTLKHADHIITAGEYLGDYLARKYRISREGISVVHSGINLPIERPVDHASLVKYHISPDNFVVLFLGRLIKENGIFDLLDAVLLLLDRGRDIKLLIAGNGELERDLRRTIRDRKAEDCIRLIGVVQGEAKDNILRRCNVLARTSYHEVFPVVYLEAASYGKPIIATAAGDTELIARDSGSVLLVDMHSPDMVAETISIVMDNPFLCTQMGLRGKIYASQYTWEIQFRRLARILDSHARRHSI